jgi:colanic acid/amylovoran biosynthesis protein
MYRVLLTGTYNSRNKGDAAMEICTANALKSALKEVEIIISTPFPEIDKDFYAPFKVVQCSRRRLIWASLQLLRAYIWGGSNKYLKCDLSFLIPETEIKTYLQSDLIVDLSGDMMTEDYGPHIAFSHFIPVLMALFLHKPFFLCAQSIGPFKLTKFIAKHILNSANIITVRDETSLRYLHEIGVRNDALFLTADMAFLLKPASSEKINSIFNNEGFTIGRSGILGVSLSQLVKSRYDKFNPLSREVDIEDLFAKVLDQIASELKLQILFIPHVTGPSKSKDDRIIGREIQSRMKEKAYVIENDYGPEELKGIISLCTVFIGARMHANIAALSSMVPVCAISYSHKTPGIMYTLGQKEFVCSIESITHDEIYSKVTSIYNKRSDISIVLKERLLNISEKSLKNIDLLITMLQQRKVNISTDSPAG